MKRHLLFRFYPGLALIAFAAGLACIFTFETDRRVALLGALIAGILGFCYFVQQQMLAETQLFKDLFTNFNTRYDALNNDLLRIKNSAALTHEDKCVVIHYLNLGLIRFRGHLPKGGYDVQNGIKAGGETGAPTVQ